MYQLRAMTPKKQQEWFKDMEKWSINAASQLEELPLFKATNVSASASPSFAYGSLLAVWALSKTEEERH
jgi:hypothetical protein